MMCHWQVSYALNIFSRDDGEFQRVVCLLKTNNQTSPKSWLTTPTFTPSKRQSSSLLLSTFKAEKRRAKKEEKVSFRVPHKLVCTVEWKDNFLGEKTLLKANRVCSCNWCWRQKLFLFTFRQLCGLILDFFIVCCLKVLTLNFHVKIIIFIGSDVSGHFSL